MTTSTLQPGEASCMEPGGGGERPFSVSCANLQSGQDFPSGWLFSGPEAGCNFWSPC
uniref:Vacuolar protein sorting 4 homolog A n=1 Tax=Homo sapiens TaxID=9606 RepID=A0AAQ5BI14_HUMAN